MLVNDNFPVIFHAISGTNEREASSPSFFNVDEALQVKSYITKLLNDRNFHISQSLPFQLDMPSSQ